MTSPRGPVYLSLPREPLAAPLPEPLGPVKPRSVPAAPHPDPQLIATLAEWIAAAEKPLIITTASGAEAMAPLGRIAEKYAHSGGDAAPARGVPADEPSDAHGLRPAGPAAGGRPDRSSIDADVPWIPNEQPPNARLPLRDDRRGPGVHALSDAQLPERSRHHRRTPRARSRRWSRRSRRSAIPRRASTRAAPAPPSSTGSARSARQGVGDADRRQDHAGLSQPPDRRDGRRRRRDLQRILADAGPLPAREAGHVLRPVSPPAGSAGASAPRSAPSSPRRTSSWSPRSATAPTCSPIRWSATGCRTCTSCRS